MQDSTTTMAISVAVAAMVLAAHPSLGHAATGSSDSALLSTPAGITLQESGGGRRRGGVDAVVDASAPVIKPGPGEENFKYPQYFAGGSGRSPITLVVFANAKGLTLYTYDKDTVPGKSACVDKCAEAWPPALVSAGAKPITDWSIISRDGGAKQWAYKGKPVYTFAKDTAVGQQSGNGLAEGAWHTLKFAPAADMGIP
ncbi:MAG: COG4315 family predicted lipoprotein, partial [Rhodospirillaceae bacterium]